MDLESTVSITSIRVKSPGVPGAEDRQQKIPGFDQGIFSKSHILFIGAGGLVSFIAPTVARKGVGRITLLDSDRVEVTNLNRQRFYPKDIGQNKAVALAENLQPECMGAAEIRGYAFRLEEAIARDMDLSCDVAVCGVDNNPARIVASRHYRRLGIPVVFTAVTANGDSGYVFVQEEKGPCVGCLYPDMASDDRYPCPRTPAIADVLELVGALSVYAIDTVLMRRPRKWNYRRVSLSDGSFDACTVIATRTRCHMHNEVHADASTA